MLLDSEAEKRVRAESGPSPGRVESSRGVQEWSPRESQKKLREAGGSEARDWVISDNNFAVCGLLG